MRDFKKYTAKEIITDLKKNNPELLCKFLLPNPKKKNHIYRIWQTKTYDFNIYSSKKFLEKLNYIHMNPIKHRIVKNLEDWFYSSFHDYNCEHKTKIRIDYIDL